MTPLQQLTRDGAKAELLKRGIKLNIGGCGCCQSPWVLIEFDNRTIFDQEGNLLMIPDHNDWRYCQEGGIE